MADALSTEVETLVRGYVDGQRFTSTNDVLLFALRVFGEFENRYQEQFGKSLEDAFAKIAIGDGITIDNKEALATVFDDIMKAGRTRYEATRNT